MGRHGGCPSCPPKKLSSHLLKYPKPGFAAEPALLPPIPRWLWGGCCRVKTGSPHPAACTAPVPSPRILRLLLHSDNLFNEAINGILCSGLEDIPGACLRPFALSFLHHPSLVAQPTLPDTPDLSPQPGVSPSGAWHLQMLFLSPFLSPKSCFSPAASFQ